MNTKQTRKDFEEWMGDGGLSPRALERNSVGDYILMQTAHAWEVWKAAHTHYAKSAAPVVLPEPAAWKYSSPFGKDRYYSERIGFPNDPYTNPEPLYTEQQVRELLANTKRSTNRDDESVGLREALVRAHDWMDSQADSQSKGGHATELRRQHARIQELEAMLDAVGAGGVSAQRVTQRAKSEVKLPIPEALQMRFKRHGGEWGMWGDISNKEYQNHIDTGGYQHECRLLFTEQQVRELLAAQTQKRKPLTDVELQAAIGQTSMQQQANCGYPSFKNLMNLARAIARAIEKAHGIGGTNEYQIT